MTGIDNQETGDEGEQAVQHALTKARFVTGRFGRDLGEDIWVESDGRRASAEGSFPYRAVIQAKGSRGVRGDTFPYDLELKHVRRWAAQPLPMFVIGVDTVSDRFFVKSIDDILVEDLGGQDALQIPGKTVRVHLPLAQEIGHDLRDAIKAHYRSSQLVLSGLPQDVIEKDYFEVVTRKPPDPGSMVPLAAWRVLWKSPRRPQHLAAMLTELARQAAHEYADAVPRPAYVIFHIYRSTFDLHHNLATVRVDWVDPSHPKYKDIIQILDAPDGIRHRTSKDVDAYREIFRAQTASPADYRQYAVSVGTLLDAMTDELLARPVVSAWDDALAARFDVVDDLWNNGPGAPIECAPLDNMLTTHYRAVFDSYFVARYRRDALPLATLERLQRQSLERMRDCRGAWHVFMA